MQWAAVPPVFAVLPELVAEGINCFRAAFLVIHQNLSGSSQEVGELQLAEAVRHPIVWVKQQRKVAFRGDHLRITLVENIATVDKKGTVTAFDHNFPDFDAQKNEISARQRQEHQNKCVLL